MRRVAEVAVVLCLLAFVVTLYGCGGSGGPNGPSENAAGKKPPPVDTSQYYVTELPKLAGVDACVEAISDVSNGTVWVGGYWDGVGYGAHPVVWEVVLPPPDQPGEQPTVSEKQLGEGGAIYDINQYGRAVGSGSDCALYYDGSALHCVQEDNAETAAFGIGTDQDTVRIAALGTSGALLWEFPFGSLPEPTNLDFTQTVLPGFDGQPSGPPACAADVSEASPDGPVWVAGRGVRDSSGDDYAVLWTRAAGAGAHFEPPEKIGLAPTYPEEVNAVGQVVGMYYNNWHESWLWQDGTLTILPWLPATKKLPWNWNRAHGVNDQGVAVGGTSYQKGMTIVDARAVLWQGGQVADLNTLVTVSGGLRSAGDINNDGMIVAVGLGGDGTLNAYLLRPK